MLQRILINAINVTAAGPKSVVKSLLPSLASAMPDSAFTVLFPEEWRAWDANLPSNIEIRYFQTKAGLRNDIERLKQLTFGLRHIAVEIHADACLTLGDHPPLGLPCPHIILLHLALLVYSLDELNGYPGWSRIKRSYLRTHFRLVAPKAAYLVVQTDVMAKRVVSNYGIDSRKVIVMPQPAPVHAPLARECAVSSPIRANPKPIKLTYLAAYYPHKNHEILPAVADELRLRGLASKVGIFTTIDLDLCASARVRGCFDSYSDVLTNIGPVKPENIAALLLDSSALFFPTIVEAFSMVYLEAMASGLPILTSDRDFAHYSCGDLAQYFDPLDPKSIADSIERFCKWRKPDDYALKAQAGLRRFPPDWDAVGRMYRDVFRRAIDSVDS